MARSAKIIVLGFIATLLLLLAHAWWPGFFTFVWITAVLVLMYGSWVWLVVSIVGELAQDRRWRLRQFLFPAIVLATVVLTWRFGIFPYAWNALVTLLLAGCVAWRGFRDYAELFRRRQQQRGPRDWQRLAAGNIPATSATKVAAVKGKLSNSCVVHGKCVPRAGAMGLISQPLRMDE